jgi:glycosyltransferase involved in cell wall biosynthesis
VHVRTIVALLDPIHVVHVVFSLDVGGQERVILDLARGAIARGHRATVLSLSEGGTLRERFAGIPVETVASGTGFHPSTMLRVGARFRRLRPDVVHTHNRTPMIYGALAARALRVRRMIHTKHGASDGGREVGVLSRLYDQYVAVSEDSATIARDRERVPARLVRVIPNGIDVRGYQRDAVARRRVRSELGLSEGACLVGTVGRLVPEKNYGLLIDAMAELLGRDVHLAFAGGGPEADALQAQVPAAKRAFVHWLGIRHDIPALLSAFDVFALSSRTEGLPLAVIEAMAAGLPVACTAVGGLPKVVEAGVTGELVPAGDRAALARCLGELARDPARRERLGEAAQQAADARFSMERVVDDYLALYRLH